MSDMNSEVVYISGLTTGGKVAPTSFFTWDTNPDTHDPATYSRTDSSLAKWGSATPGTSGGTIKYYFDTASSWTATEKNAFKAAMALWSDVANITFSQTTSSAAAQITIHRGSDGGAYDQSAYSGYSTSGDVKGTELWTFTSATVSIDTSVAGFGPIDGTFSKDGGYPWTTILHELGHAIGLGHPGPYNEGDLIDPATHQFGPYDMRLWSVMSYIAPGDTATYSSSYPVTGTDWGTVSEPDGHGGSYIYDRNPTTVMPLDILAAQALYGTPATTAFNGNDIFGFNCNISDATEKFYDFTINTDPVVTIWDAGRHNTLDLSGFSSASTIDLDPGSFSSCDGLVNNIGIAFNTRIDLAIGGSGADEITGNIRANVLWGGGGDDVINGGVGRDRIKGGSGNDTINGGSGSDVIYGGSGNDTMNGGDGNDFIYRRRRQRHHLNGGDGADALTGGKGIDTFIYSSVSDSTSTGFDTIARFDATADKIDLPFTVTGINTARTVGTLNDASFDSNMASNLTAARLGAHHAILFTPSGGDEAGHTFLVVDANGTAGYQASADYVIELTAASNLSSLSTADFV